MTPGIRGRIDPDFGTRCGLTGSTSLRESLRARASITSMIRHYVARRAQVTEGHPRTLSDEMSAVHALVRRGGR